MSSSIPTSDLSPPAPAASERRRRRSDLESASKLLSHAVEYLIAEQLMGRRSPVQANREAVAILCEAGRMIAQQERRKPARSSIAAWLRGASLFRSER